MVHHHCSEPFWENMFKVHFFHPHPKKKKKQQIEWQRWNFVGHLDPVGWEGCCCWRGEGGEGWERCVERFGRHDMHVSHGYIYIYISGQIIATSHDLTPNGGLVREIPLFQGNLGWWNIIIWADILYCICIYTLMLFAHVKIHIDKVANLYAHRNLRNPFWII